METTQELTQLSEKELESRAQKLRDEYAYYAYAVASGTETNTARLRQLRRDIARVETMRRQKMST